MTLGISMNSLRFRMGRWNTLYPVREPDPSRYADSDYQLIKAPGFTQIRKKPKASQRSSKPTESLAPKPGADTPSELTLDTVIPFSEDNGDLEPGEKLKEGKKSSKRRSRYGFNYKQQRTMSIAFGTRKIDFENPVMITLSYRTRGDAPTYQGVRKQMLAFKKLFETGWGVDLQGIWKIESSKSGVAHIHEYMEMPSGVSRHVTKAQARQAKFGHLNGLEFEEWLDLAWQTVTNQNPVEEMPHLTKVSVREGGKDRARRYLLKSKGRKRYQNKAPKGWEADQMQLWGRHGLTEIIAEVHEFKGDKLDQVMEVARSQAERPVDWFNEETGELGRSEPKRFRSRFGKGGFNMGDNVNHEDLIKIINSEEVESK